MIFNLKIIYKVIIMENKDYDQEKLKYLRNYYEKIIVLGVKKF